MSELRFRIEDGPLQGWYAEYHAASAQLRPLSQTLIVQPPAHLDAAALRVSLSLTIRPGDPQWEVMKTLARQQANTAHAQQTRAAALGLLLPRVRAGMAVRDGWHVQRGSSPTPAISGRLTDLTGPESTVRVSAADNWRPADSRRQLHTRIARDGLDTTFGWVRQNALATPGLPAGQSRPEWTGHTEQFLRTPLPGQPRPGQYVIEFVNATASHGLHRRIADNVEQAQHWAATHRPFNNTDVTVALVVGVDNGWPVTEPVDLGPAARPGPHRPAAAAAFPVPPAARPSTGAPPPAETTGPPVVRNTPPGARR
ncbi:hypothetical protein [Actinoplanes sp. L3-i22]|uniref:hypothetical protein n=1 Tax=Actinoplanes sp. L3-i22 TaxID=2836373 RepID=UPI001C796B74|nr:hypothetical protein [Actinoplanes sp. L3-i22]BCY10978.1 hypothetical protein L3i22_060660 [Actinoplanes sp. L3-i22]